MDQLGFKKNRETFTIQIRKQTRQNIFYKLRNINQGETMENQASSQVVLDENLRSLIESCHTYKFSASQIEQLCQGLNSLSHEVRHQSTIGLRKLLSQGQVQPYLQIIVDKGVISKLISLILDKRFPQLQFQACWIITNIAFSSSSHCDPIVEKNGIEAIMKLLYQNSGPVIDQALWGLGNIAGDCIECRNKVIMQGGVECALRIIQGFPQPQTVQLGCWVLSNLCRGEPVPSYDFIKKAIPVLGEKIVKGQLQGNYLISALWSLCVHSQSKNKIRTILSVQNLVKRLIQICSTSSDHSILIPALRILGNISTGTTSQTDQLLNHNILQLLAHLLAHTKRSLRRQACWIMSNIAAGPEHHVQKIVHFPKLIKTLAEKLLYDQYDVRREICFIFSNICRLGSPHEIFTIIVQYRFIEILANLLKIEDDHKILEGSLRCLYEFLAVGSRLDAPNPILKLVQATPTILDRIQSLQHHISDQVYQQVSKICQRFFTLEDSSF